MEAGLKLTTKDCPSSEAAAVMTDKRRLYRTVLAAINHIMNWTRPDVVYAVSKLCPFRVPVHAQPRRDAHHGAPAPAALPGGRGRLRPVL